MEERRAFDLVLKQHAEEEIQRYEDLKKDIKELKDTVNGLVDTWNQAKGVLSFIKWVIGISGSLTAFFIFIKDHFK